MIEIMALVLLFFSPCQPDYAYSAGAGVTIFQIDARDPGHQQAVSQVLHCSAPQARSLVLAVSTTDELTQAIDLARMRRAKVINLSIGTTCDCVRAAIDRAVAADIAVIAAAGNGTPATYFPAAYPGVMSVAASDGPASPSWVTATGGYSSYATPKVAGLAARIRALRPSLTAQDTLNIISATLAGKEINPVAALRYAAVR